MAAGRTSPARGSSRRPSRYPALALRSVHRGSVATVELLILLVVGIWLFGKFFSDEVTKATDPTTVARWPSSASSRSAASCRSRPSRAKAGQADAPRGETSVLVLNGNGTRARGVGDGRRGPQPGLHDRGDRERRPTDYPRSIVMYRPGFKREAQRLAKDFGVRRVVPLDGMRRAPGRAPPLGAHVASVGLRRLQTG